MTGSLRGSSRRCLRPVARPTAARVSRWLCASAGCFAARTGWRGSCARTSWRPATTDSNHRQPVAANRLAKVLAPDQPDRIWVADITYTDTGEGWLYSAGSPDACSRRLVGWQPGETLQASLVTQARQKAVHSRQPGPGLLHYSDRGAQFFHVAQRKRVAQIPTRPHNG